MKTLHSDNTPSFWTLLRKSLAGEEIDFTKGKLSYAIFLLAIPMILEMVMESIFAVVDIMFVSQVSIYAVATIGLTESVIALVYAISIGMGIAVTALVSRRVGEKNLADARSITVQAIYFGLGVSTFISIIGLLYPHRILQWMGAEPDLIQEGFRYTQLMLAGNVSIMLLFILNGVFRGAGDAGIAMWVLVVSNVINIILDPIFIFGWGPVPQYGVTGAAMATTISRSLAVIFQVVILFRGWSRIQLFTRDLVLSVSTFWNLVKISLGGMAQYLIGSASWIFLMRIMAEFGSEALAGYTIAIRIILFTIMPSWGMSNAAATLVGQNLGANQPDRAEKSVWLTGFYNALFMVLVSLVYIFYAPQLMHWFTDEETVIHSGTLCLRILAAAYLFYAYGMVLVQAFNGAGDTRTPTWINLVCFWIIQIPLAYVIAIPLGLGEMGVYICIALADVLVAIISYVIFRRGAWKKVKV